MYLYMMDIDRVTQEKAAFGNGNGKDETRTGQEGLLKDGPHDDPRVAKEKTTKNRAWRGRVGQTEK